MASSNHEVFDDRFLARYLLGDLSPEEAERVDALSITDEEFSWRLSAVENDLVDAYVRGELSGKDLEQFRSSYLSSPRRHKKVDFAQGLLALEQRTATQRTEASERQGAKRAALDEIPVRLVLSRYGFLRAAFAGAGFVLLLVVIYLSIANLRLHEQISEMRQQQEAINQRNRELEQQINAERTANGDNRTQLERLRQSQPDHQLRTVSLLMPPPTRGATRISTISLHPGTDLFVVLLLAMESNEFAAYRAELKDPANGQVVWRSAEVKASSLNDKHVVSVSFPSSLLKQQNYIAELAGLGTARSEVVGDYAFRVVLK
jgi:hypothetical protein